MWIWIIIDLVKHMIEETKSTYEMYTLKGQTTIGSNELCEITAGVDERN